MPENPEAVMHVGVALVALGRATGRMLTEALEPTGLKPRHLNILAKLSRAPVTQQSLSEAVGMESTQLVVVLNELEEARLITRRRDPDDRRRHIVKLSAAGANRFTDAERRIQTAEQCLLAGIDRKKFTLTLSRLGENAGISLECGSVDETAEL